MRAFMVVTKRFFAEIWSDAMLVTLLFVPILIGCVFHFGIPALETLLCSKMATTELILPYYPILDLVLSILTPMMFIAAGAMVILDESDFGLTRAIAVTPVKRSGYLLSRIGVPVIISSFYCVVITAIFKLSEMPLIMIIVLAICSALLGVVVSLMISSMANNKVEGMAFSKLSGLFVIGIPASIFITSPVKYVFGILPTFWTSEYVLSGNLLFAIPAISTSILWIILFTKRFMKKVLT